MMISHKTISLDGEDTVPNTTEFYQPKHNMNPLSVICEVINPTNEKSQKIRVIFDNCSSVTLLRRKVAENLGLGSKPVNLAFTTTGNSCQTHKNEFEVNLLLKAMNSDFTSHEIQAVTIHEVSKKFKRPIIHVDQIPHFKMIDDLTEDYSAAPKYATVDLLLGNPHSLILAPEQTIMGPTEDSPIAVKTKLGTCLSGNLNPDRNMASYNTSTKETTTVNMKANRENTDNAQMNTTVETVDTAKDQPKDDIDSLMEDAKQVYQPLTFAQNADQHELGWMSLQNLAIDPEDRPGKNEDLTLGELENERMIKASRTYSKEDLQYTLSLPFRGTDRPSNNAKDAYALAMKTLQRLKKKDPKLLEHFLKALKEGFEWKFFVKVPPEDLKKTDGFYCIPILPVKQPNKPDHYCRITLMANHKSANGKTINDCLHTGKDLLPNLVQMTIRFRASPYVLVLDLKRMFQQIALTPDSQEMLRFYAPVEENGEIKLETWRCATLPFGLSCSPHIAESTLHHHSEEYKNDPKLAKASAQISNNTYVDDVHILTANEEELAPITKDVDEILRLGHFTSGKYASNSAKTLAQFPTEKLSKEELVSVLGTQWHPKQDEIRFKFLSDNEEKPIENITKRTMLSNLARIFDATGILSAYMIKGRLTLQKTWIKQITWDTQLEGELLEEAQAFISEIPHLYEFRQPRCFLNTPQSELKEILVTCDASTSAYCANVFLISIDPDGTQHSHLAFAKARVKPLSRLKSKKLSEPMSVARLELLAAVLAATIGVFIQKTFQDKKLPMKFFSDSQINLYRLLNDPLTFQPWVANRVRQITKLTDVDNWFYIKSTQNVASDLTSRGCSLSELLNSKEYWQGPAFFCDPNHNYEEMSIKNIQHKKNIKQLEDEERKAAKPTCLTFNNPGGHCDPQANNLVSHHLCLKGPPNQVATDADFHEFWLKEHKQPEERGLVNRYSSWQLLRGVTGRLLQFIKAAREGWSKRTSSKPTKLTLNLKIDDIDKNKTLLNQSPLPAQLVMEAELMLIRVSQYDSHKDEIQDLHAKQKIPRSSKLWRFRPFWDEQDSVIRITGRAPSADLIVLPKDHQIVDKFVRWTHNSLHHLSPFSLRNRIQDLGFILVGGIKQYKKLTHKCVCRPPVKLWQEMDKIPSERLGSTTETFDYIAIDFTGVFTVYENDSPRKCYVMVIADLTTRFISVEVVENMSTSAFIEAFRCYSATRSAPYKVFSDRGTNLISGEKVLRKVLQNLDWSQIKNFGRIKNFEWHFTSAARSASFNGSIEIAVKLFKKALNRAIQFDRTLTKPRKLSLTQFKTICYEAAQLTNDRPLHPFTDQEDHLTYVTPNKLVFGKQSQPVPLKVTGKDLAEQGLDIDGLYKQRTKILRTFWTEFKSTYQLSMNISKQWLDKFNGEIPPGTLIHYRDGQHMKPGQYQIGVVITANKRADGRIKTLTLRTPTNKNPITRDIRQCFLSEGDFDKLTNYVHSCLLSQDPK